MRPLGLTADSFEVAIMDDWALLESVEGLGEWPALARSGALWELLQGEREQVCREISGAGTLVHINGYATNERDLSDEYIEAIDWRHRDQLEQRLRDVIDAQDRLSEGSYGRCAECGTEIEPDRLIADPAASFCLSCQQSAEPEFAFHTI
jgi:RNA polymerase-binding transcription factor DksA